MAKTTKQTTRLNGKRVRIVTTTSNSGTRVQVTDAPVEEWILQAAAVRALKALPEYVADAKDVRPGTFTLAGDFNAARRSMREQVKAKATGLTSGEHDKRIYMWPAASTAGGVLGLIEYKGEKTPVSKDQKERHALLSALGFRRQAILRATTEDDAAQQAVALVCGWLAEENEIAA